MDRKRVGILVCPNVEVLDFCGPFEVFSVTRLNEEARREEPSPFEVLLVAESKDTVVATGGLKVVPDVTLDTCPPLDILVVPGGWGTRSEINNERLVKWIGERGREVETLPSVCTGSMLLGKAGLLDGRRATTHWAFAQELHKRYPGIQERLCDDQGRVRRFVNLYVNGDDIRFLNSLDTSVKDGDEVSIVPAIAGG